MSDARDEPAACEICFTRPPPGALRHCPRCTAHICASCFAAWLHVRIQYATASNLTCLSCPEPIPDTDLRAAVGDRAYRRCLYLRSRHAHRDDPAAAWCPADGCWALLPPLPTSATTASAASAPASRDCPHCGLSLCPRCNQPAHAGRCAAPVARPGHRVASAVWRRLHTKKCPSCAVRIQRAGGCTQMHCTSCHTKFCWRCRGLLHLPYDAPPPGLAGSDPDARPVVATRPARSAVAQTGPTPRRAYAAALLVPDPAADDDDPDVDVTLDATASATASASAAPSQPQPAGRKSAAQRHLYGCVCPRVHAVLTHIGMVGGVVIATPVVLAAAVVATPPAVVTYACLSKQKKERLRKDLTWLTQRI